MILKPDVILCRPEPDHAAVSRAMDNGVSDHQDKKLVDKHKELENQTVRPLRHKHKLMAISRAADKFVPEMQTSRSVCNG